MKTPGTIIAATMLAAAPSGAMGQSVPVPSPTSEPPQLIAPLPSDPAAARAVQPQVGDGIYDKNGEQIGTVASTNGQHAVLTTSKGKITVPLAAMFAGAKGPTINATREEVEAAIQAPAH